MATASMEAISSQCQREVALQVLWITSPKKASPEATSDGKVTICHTTGSQTNPYNEIAVRINGLDGHDKQEGDIILAPQGTAAQPQDQSFRSSAIDAEREHKNKRFSK